MHIDEVIAAGPYKDTWESLCNYRAPKWYAAAKFGIFIHWGVYAVPAFGSEKYPRNMYKRDSPEYAHHLKTYGSPKDFGYKDFIPFFKAEHFDAREWINLFKKAGARYVMPVAEHHDGFAMYKTELSPWNAAEMGPKRDILMELKTAAEEGGIYFSVSSHRAEQFWYYNTANGYDNDVNDPANRLLYGSHSEGGGNNSDIYRDPPPREHCEDWLARTCELAEKYRPQIVWFDTCIHQEAWKPYLKKFAAFYYNLAAKWGIEVAINYKHNAMAFGSGVLDLERGKLSSIWPQLWQTDTSTTGHGWGYLTDNVYKKPVTLVCDLVDIVSKNGAFLLNIGPRADGTIPEGCREILLAIGEWLQENGEGIYNTVCWQWYGEGPTQVKGGAYSETVQTFTSDDFRFTYRNGTLYAFVMKYPRDGRVIIPSLKKSKEHGGGDFLVRSVRVLGRDKPVDFERDEKALSIRVRGDINTEYPVGFAITID
jgi:alpha-L-fucosidase